MGHRYSGEAGPALNVLKPCISCLLGVVYRPGLLLRPAGFGMRRREDPFPDRRRTGQSISRSVCETAPVTEGQMPPADKCPPRIRQNIWLLVAPSRL